MSKEAERLRRLAELRRQATQAAIAKGHAAVAAGEKALRGMGNPEADLARASSKFTEQSAQLDTAIDRIGATLDSNIDKAEVDAVVAQAQHEATLELLRNAPEPPKGIPDVAAAPTPQKPSPRPVQARRVVSPPVVPVAAVTHRPAPTTTKVLEDFKAKIDARMAAGQKEVADYCKQQGLDIDQAKRAFAESMTSSREEITAKKASFNSGTIEYKILDAALKMIDIDHRINNQNIADANSVPEPYRAQAIAYSATNIVAKKNNSRNRVEERIRLKGLLERRGIQEVEKRPGLFGRVTRQIKKWWEKLAGKPKSTLGSAVPGLSKPAAEAKSISPRTTASKIAGQIRIAPGSAISPDTSPPAAKSRRGQTR